MAKHRMCHMFAQYDQVVHASAAVQKQNLLCWCGVDVGHDSNVQVMGAFPTSVASRMDLAWVLVPTAYVACV